MTERDEFKQEFEKKWTKQQWKLAAGTMGAFSLIDALSYLGPSHLGAGGIVAGLITAAIVGDQGEKVASGVRDALPDFLVDKIKQVADRPSGNGSNQQSRPKDARNESQIEALSDDVQLDLNGVDDFTRPQKSGNYILMSEVLQFFVPTVNQIFLARTEENQDLYCPARALCHVALAGSTGGGKSSLIRMLMLQLCKARLQVLLLNPHYTDYDLETDGPDGKPCPEDWTPFKPYLMDDPIKCMDYGVIDHYLKDAAKHVIPKRLERRAKGIPVGKPYFLVLDELPAIIKNVKNAPDYLGDILREGRKVGVFLISASQDFLVKTIAPDGSGGAVRDCYRTAYYVGGDATTAKILLDMPANKIAEDEMGKGAAMLRSAACKKAIKVFIPYVDNEALYRELGPSTYKQPITNASIDLPRYEAQRPVYEQTAQLSFSSGNQVAQSPYAQPEGLSISEIEKMKTVKQPAERDETPVKSNENDETFRPSREDETAILMAVFDLQKAGAKVTREAIKSKLGWNNAKHPSIKAVCDKYHIAER